MAPSTADTGAPAAAGQERQDPQDTYDVLRTPPEGIFDRVTRLTTRVFDVPISAITFAEGNREWFKSRQGLTAGDTEGGPALCNAAMKDPGPLVVADVAADARFRDNPLVAGEHVRFYAGVPIRSPSGLPIGTLCAMDRAPRQFGERDLATLTDLGHLVTDILTLRLEAATDSLTGAMSRRAFRTEAGRILSLARRHKQDCSLLVLDLDHFRLFNERYGHDAGDAVLRSVASIVSAHLRTSDLFGRAGGEKFAILLPQTGQKGALEVAERLRQAVSRAQVTTEHGVHSVTVSIGVAALDRSNAVLDAILTNADDALKRAKAGGRNRCEAWEPPQADLPAQRRRVLKAGRITFNGGRSTIDCTVRWLSGTDATVEAVSAEGIPDRFKLQIESEGFSKLCRIIGKREKQIDVGFE